ncbi:hypothetical protein Salat_2594400 [Sesamum alatum]|uniref:Uncharacterized protein n=1 Tax=Sesamum alatum TaxID=300844 RepID=A0AAE2CAA9_9LAMI|nr:hypothetical protein Salat_2594400 [Sesamum alatum]
MGYYLFSNMVAKEVLNVLKNIDPKSHGYLFSNTTLGASSVMLVVPPSRTYARPDFHERPHVFMQKHTCTSSNLVHTPKWNPLFTLARTLKGWIMATTLLAL